MNALLEGRKFQTRRIVKPQPTDRMSKKTVPPQILKHPPKHAAPYFDRYHKGPFWCWWDEYDRQGPDWIREPCRPGDLLWVREGHALVPASAYRMSEGVRQAVNPDDPDRAAVYREGFDRSCGGFRWRPSIHMPRWASRITLVVTDIRPERVQDISEDDARAEGLSPHPNGKFYIGEDDEGPIWAKSPITAFANLWNSIHGPDAWGRNDWVWRLSFDVHRCNIDSVEAQP